MVNIEHGGEIRSISSVIFDGCGFKSNNKDSRSTFKGRLRIS